VLEKSTDKALIQLVLPGDGENFLFSGLSGLLKSAEMENSTLFCQTILLPGTPEPITEVLRENAGCPGDYVIRYQDDKRLVAGFESVGDDLVSETPVPWKDEGVYLITGGAGGLGRIFAREIASRVTSPVIILTGRSTSGASVAGLLTELSALGARAEYRKADVGKKAEVRKLISAVKKAYGLINGIIHSAGMIRDNVITKKTRQDVKAVLAPKVVGLANLDEASADLPLDLFILFSSAAGAMGNIGQADYACANGFMDAYAEYRGRLVAAGKRSGKTLSVNWPLWQDGGMQVDDETLKLLNMNLGMTALETGAGIEALYNSLNLNLPRTLVARGNIAKLRQKLLAPVVSVSEAPPSPAHTNADGLTAEIISGLAAAVSKMMKIRIEKIDPEEELGSYGFDSISLTELTNTINEQWALELQPTLFFEYPTLAGYAEYLADTHAAELAPQFDSVTVTEKKDEGGRAEGRPTPERNRPRFISQTAAQQDRIADDVPVAVVGISGRFPMAEDVAAFWKNLEAGRHCITEIPEDRWDWKRFAGDTPEGETGVRWGGFIEGVGDFDPMFFGISPREAELMDPQQRLMMLYVWKAVEDAGIAPGVLSRTPTGVFISPGINEYMHLPGFPQNDPYAPMGLAISGIPNRISYALNLHGPSEYCETACSSALVALHRAIAAMRMGECEQAIIGAVNLLLSPDGFSGVDAFGHLSPSGKPKSFQADADGYVRSEGVGAMLIKPLDKAVRDKDRIYAVIRGTGIAHGGKGMSLTAPTGSGMKAAMTQAFRNANVDPGTIAYMEAHGTATPMGDAVEINTLASGYAEISEQGNADIVQQSDADRPVYISSLKPCIGHGEIVSGMAALIKVIMALKHKTIPGLPGFGSLNENISLDGSRFDISADNHPWDLLTGADGNPLPRRAAINSYGFGGVNAHAVIEEYVDKNGAETGAPEIHAQESVQHVFVLSARSPERLKVYAGNLADFLTDTDARLADVAYT
ncbi:MAG: SDR family NAD(P)-dependent oxidoreductase, partial [Desulfobacterales bacterium]|nr:SDR family NAD(P)-dependent oxidoreductase [Desulfobacterales bacterium]